MELCKLCPITVENCPRGSSNDLSSQECEPRKRWRDLEQLYNDLHDIYQDHATENALLKDKIATLNHELGDWKNSLRGVLSQRISRADLFEACSLVVYAIGCIGTGKSAVDAPSSDVRNIVERLSEILQKKSTS